MEQSSDTILLAPELRDAVLRYAAETGLSPQDAANHLIQAGLAQVRHPTPASNQ